MIQTGTASIAARGTATITGTVRSAKTSTRRAIRHALYELMVGDSGLLALFSATPRIERRQQGTNVKFPYIVHDIALRYTEDGAVGIVSWSLDIYDRDGEATTADLIAERIIALADGAEISTPNGECVGLRFTANTLNEIAEPEPGYCHLALELQGRFGRVRDLEQRGL